jgi:hypothetical protein
MRLFNLLPLLVIGTLLSACGAQSVPTAPQQAGAANASQSQVTTAGVIKPSVSATYSCKSSLGISSWSADVTGTTPGSVTPGTPVSMTGFQATVTIPASLVDELITKGATAVTMEATVLDVNSTDAKPKTVNSARSHIKFGPVKLYEGMPAVFPLPQYPITIGTWTAGSKGTMVFTAGSAELILTASKLTVKATCKPSSHTTISTTTVS